MTKNKELTILSFLICIITIFIGLTISCPIKVLGGSGGGDSSSSSPYIRLIDNFDVTDDDNLLGGINCEWGTALTRSYDETNDMGGTGYALKIDYDMTLDTSSDAVSDAVFPIGSSYKNFTSYDNLIFYIKGDPDNYNTGIKDSSDNKNVLAINDYIAGGIITNTYNKVAIPLADFTDVDMENVEFVYINFDLSSDLSNDTGTIYIDDIGTQEAVTSSSSSSSWSSSSSYSSSSSSSSGL
ncbi:MAG: hypothetical protein KAT05_14790 [Spirochaetes bacterium]|nr:hypothetical protein [Spirochaetota bacterium]